MKTGDAHRRGSGISSTDAAASVQESKSKPSCEMGLRTQQPDSGLDTIESGDGREVVEEGVESGGGSGGRTRPWSESPARFQRLVWGQYGQREFSLLHVAAAAGHTSVITALLEAGCDPTLRSASWGGFCCRSRFTTYAMVFSKFTFV